MYNLFLLALTFFLLKMFFLPLPPFFFLLKTLNKLTQQAKSLIFLAQLPPEFNQGDTNKLTTPQEALSSHLCPILSLCLDKAFSAISCDANWTYASPVLLPCRSSGSIIPFGTISNPIAPRPNEKHDISHIYCHNVQQVIALLSVRGGLSPLSFTQKSGVIVCVN